VTNITYFQVTSTLCGRVTIAMAADDVTNVTLVSSSSWIVIRDSSGHLCNNKSFMTMDNISIMCRNSLLCCFLTWIVYKAQIFCLCYY